MEINTYQTRAEMLLRSYILSDSFIVYSSVIGGVFACKLTMSEWCGIISNRGLNTTQLGNYLVYDLSQIFSSIYFKRYAGLSKSQQVEWNNRSISTVHAIFITAMSLFLAFWSDLFSDDQLSGLVIMRSSTLSTSVLGVSVGYFLTDLAMILWFYPSLGGMEYLVHHLLSLVALSYAMLTGEAQFYVYMVLLSEATTPGINLRWYLDVAGLKKSKAYLINGFMMVFVWLVARILVFIYLFYHLYAHYDQVMKVSSFGIFLVCVVPLVLAVMNLVWFWKIVKGLKKTLSKRN